MAYSLFFNGMSDNSPEVKLNMQDYSVMLLLYIRNYDVIIEKKQDRKE